MDEIMEKGRLLYMRKAKAISSWVKDVEEVDLFIRQI